VDQKEWKVYKNTSSRKALLSIQEYISERDQLWELDDHLLLQQRTDGTKKIHQMLGSTKGNIRIRTVLIKLKCVCVSVNIKEKAQRAISLMKTSQSTWSTSLVQW